MKILVANLGSTSIKLKLFEMQTEQVFARVHLERIGESYSPISYFDPDVGEHNSLVNAVDIESGLHAALAQLTHPESGCLNALSELDGIGFKAVHAGDFYGPALVDDELIARMGSFNAAAPKHNPAYCLGMQLMQKIAPTVPQVAHFETGFHQTIPDFAWIYSVPYEWYQKYGIRRYGFHGSSFTYLAQRTPALLNRPVDDLSMIVCHLGGSSSICAIQNGRSIDTSMGFTPQAGIPMGTRSGDFDPFVIPYIMDRLDYNTTDIRTELSENGGLLGISGISADLRDLEEAAVNGVLRAKLSLQAFAYTVKKYIGAYAASLGGLDVLVFSGGIGENSPKMRARICNGLDFLGISLDRKLNKKCCGAEMLISEFDAMVPVWVVPTNEELIVARATLKVIRERSSKQPET